MDIKPGTIRSDTYGNPLPQFDIILGDDDALEVRTYRPAGGGARNLAIDINGITVLRVGGLKAVPELVQE